MIRIWYLCFRTVLVGNEWKGESPVSNIDDLVSVIRSDYEKAYFVTGIGLYFLIVEFAIRLLFQAKNNVSRWICSFDYTLFSLFVSMKLNECASFRVYF